MYTTLTYLADCARLSFPKGYLSISPLPQFMSNPIGAIQIPPLDAAFLLDVSPFLFMGIAVVNFALYWHKGEVARKTAQTYATLNAEYMTLLHSHHKLQHFSSNVSHDILSSLNVILSTGNVLIGRNPNNQQRLTQYYEVTQNVSYRLRQYCMELLEEAMSKEPTSLPDKATVNELLDDVLLHYTMPLQVLNFHVTKEPLPALLLPKVVVHQLLHNVLTNALKYVPQEGRSPRLHFGHSQDAQGRPCWIITDNGPGMHAGNTARKGEQQGYGIGLKKLQETLDTYGYKLRFDNLADGGLSICVQPVSPL